jgi:hypothetical protein
MARRLDRIILLGGLATVAACIEVAPRSSVRSTKRATGRSATPPR